MGNPGSIEKVMVFGILVIILGILAIAVYGSRNVAVGADGQLAVAPPGVQNQLPIKGAGGGLRGSDDAEPGGDASQDSVNVLIVDPSDLENVTAIDDKGFDDNTVGRPVAKEPTPSGESVAATPAAKDDNSKSASKLPGTYKVEKNDTLEAIAKKLYKDRAYVDDILAANAGLNPTKMFVGQEIKIPPMSSKATADVVKAPQKPEASGKPVVPPPGDGAGLAKEPSDKTYTIQPGDSLIKIARNQCGGISKVNAIKALNKGVITDPDHLPVGKSIRLP